MHERDETMIQLNEEKQRADRHAAVATELLDRNRVLVIQRALLRAFEGNVKAVDEIVYQYDEVFGADEWSTILRGAAQLHAGNYKEARELLTPLFNVEAESAIPAIAMLSTAYMYDGDWDSGIVFANKLRDARPRSGEFGDLDQLFLGYALVFVDTQRSVDLLQGVLERNPTWLACHAVLTDAQIHLGNFNGNDALIDDALRKSNALVQLIDENPFALNVCLFAHRASIERRQLQNAEYDDLTDTAGQLVARLRKYDHFILAQAMPAQCYDVIGEDEKAKECWNTVLARGGQMWRWTAIGRLYWTKNSSELMTIVDDLGEDDAEPWVLAAKAYILADLPGGRAKAMSLFRRIIRRKTSMSDRYFAIHIPLLVGEKEIAVKTAREWVGNWQAGQHSEWNDQELLRIIATDGEQLPESKSRMTRVLTNHMLGLLAIADGERDEARRHFEASAEKPWVNIDFYWGAAFARLLSADDNWPSQNKAMQQN